jgi:hypothetical protein
VNVDQIEAYFNATGIPGFDVEITKGIHVPKENAELFVINSIRSLKSHPKQQAYMPYYLHLLNYTKKVQHDRHHAIQAKESENPK